MIDLDLTIVIQAINFLIMWVLLNVILFKPIRGIIKKRKEFGETQLAAIESFSTQAVTKVQDYEEALSFARASGVEERTRLKEEGLAKEAELVGEAAKASADKLAEARAAVQKEYEAAFDGLKSDVQKMAEKAVDKILA